MPEGAQIAASRTGCGVRSRVGFHPCAVLTTGLIAGRSSGPSRGRRRGRGPRRAAPPAPPGRPPRATAPPGWPAPWSPPRSGLHPGARAPAADARGGGRGRGAATPRLSRATDPRRLRWSRTAVAAMPRPFFLFDDLCVAGVDRIRAVRQDAGKHPVPFAADPPSRAMPGTPLPDTTMNLPTPLTPSSGGSARSRRSPRCCAVTACGS